VGPRATLDSVARNINEPGSQHTTWFDTGLASFGHYSGAETSVPFTIANGAYQGSADPQLPNASNVATMSSPAWFAVEQDVKYR